MMPDRGSKLTPERWQNPITPVPLDHIVIPKRRSSLRRNTYKGNGSTGSQDVEAVYGDKTIESGIPPIHSPLSSFEDLEDLTAKTKTLEITKRTPMLTTLSSSQRVLLTPPYDTPAIYTPSGKDQLPSDKGYHEPYFVTPVKRRAINYGRVVDTPPSSTDRFIPSRTRDDTAINNFKANKPFFELTAAQKQMRMNSITPDPFTARRVTPHSIARRDASSGHHHQFRTTSASNVWTIGGSVPHRNHVVAIDTGRGITLGSGTNARMFSANFFDRQTEKESNDRYEARLAMALELDRSSKVLDFNFGLNKRMSPKHAKKTTEWKDSMWTSHEPHSGKQQVCLLSPTDQARLASED